jgi:chorismate mutase
MSKDLSDWREQINLLDQKLIAILEERFAVVEKIADFKRANQLPVRDKSREEELIGRISVQTKLSSEFIRDLYQTLFNYSYLIEQ